MIEHDEWPTEAPLLVRQALGTAAEVVDDLEGVRIANENRVRTLTDPEYGGMSAGHDDIQRLTLLIAALNDIEGQAIKNLEKAVRQHPLWERWGKQMPGVGEKQFGRLLGVIQDPYWNDLHGRPRTRGELAAYCGVHVVNGQAPHKVTGKKINWNSEARKRLWLVASKTIFFTGASYEVTTGKQAGQIVTRARSPYRDIYDAVKEEQAGALHVHECRRCGPAGKPALVGSPLSDGHKHARGIRKVMHSILNDLWDESSKVYAERGFA